MHSIYVMMSESQPCMHGMHSMLAIHTCKYMPSMDKTCSTFLVPG